MACFSSQGLKKKKKGFPHIKCQGPALLAERAKDQGQKYGKDLEPQCYTALGKTPDASALAHVRIIGETSKKNETPNVEPPKDPQSKAEKATALFIGAGLPLVPQKLVQRIQAGEFIDMAELLPDRLGVNAGPPVEGDKDDKTPRRCQVTNILEWIQCYSIYMAVRLQKYPDKVQDMLGYQALIVEARMEYEGDGWLGYDRRFRQTAAA